MMISWVYLSSAAGVPDTEVGSRRLERLTPALHPSPLCGLVLPLPHTLKSVLMQSDHDFLGLPRPRAHGISMFIMVLVQFLREAWSNHLRCLVRRAMAATSWIPNLVYRESVVTLSLGLTQQIQRTMALSLRSNRCKSEEDGAQDSLPCRSVDLTQALKTFPRVLRDIYVLRSRLVGAFWIFPRLNDIWW